MFDWIKGYSLIDIQDEQRHDFPHHSFHMEKIDAVNEPASMTALGQFFAAAAILVSEHMMLEIPVYDEETSTLIMEQIALHFAQVRRVKQENEPEAIRMQTLKPESRVLYNRTKTEALSLIEDVYRQRVAMERPHTGIRNLQYYTLENRKLEPYEPEELKDLQELLTRAFIQPGKEFNITPLGWIFDAYLSRSIAIRFFSSFIPAVTVCVNEDTDEIVLLQLAGQEMKHPLIIPREEFGQTRKVGSFLYLCLNGGLVYVIDLQNQAPIERWADLKACTLFQMGTDIRFSQFSHISGEPVREGISLLFDQDTLHTLAEIVNRHCSER